MRDKECRWYSKWFGIIYFVIAFTYFIFVSVSDLLFGTLFLSSLLYIVSYVTFVTKEAYNYLMNQKAEF